MSSIEYEQLQRAINEKVEIADYDSDWPQRFEAESRRLKELCGVSLSKIEHVGSTAVPGLPAKPIIDIIAVAPSVEEADTLVELLCANGYTTSVEFNATLGDKRWLMRQQGGRRTHHLHLVPPGNDEWLNKVRFRDLLRKDSDLRRAYIELKRRLADELCEDREAYTDAKTAFVRNALKTG
jgi:GrpB-like predicted nucleotidyltransferase (UPF0157 family)